MTDRDIAPHSVEAEEATIGGALIDAESIVELSAIVSPEDFFIVRNGWIWEAITNLHSRREPIDYLTIISELEVMGRLQEVGGAAYVLSLVNKTPSALNVEGYAAIVERMALRRRLLQAASNIARIAHSEETDIDEVVGQAEGEVHAVTRGRREDKSVTNRQMMSRHHDITSERARHPEETAGYPTGLIDLDHLLGGLRPADLVLIGGRPGMGKSALLENILRDNAKQGVGALFVSIEMTEEQVASRQIAAEAGLDLKHIREATMTEYEWRVYTNTISRLSTIPLRSEFPSRLTPARLETMIARAKYDNPDLSIVGVDYIQLMYAAGFGRGDKRVAEMTYISRELKVMAKEYDVVMVCAAQLNRNLESRNDKRPLLSDLKESGSLEQDADVVLFPYRDSYYNPDMPEGDELNVAKNRNGKTGMVKVVWQGEFVRFVSAVQTHVELN